MPKRKGVCLLCPVRRLCLLAFIVLSEFAVHISAQTKTTQEPFYARVNTFGVFGAYSWDSSHIFLGYAQNRKLLSFGVAYNRRLLVGKVVSWQYSAELLPVALESDPVVQTVFNQETPTVQTFITDLRQSQACIPGTVSYSATGPDGVVYSGTVATTCGRTWTVGEAFSPVGFQWNFRPRHKLQPIVVAHGGYMYSTQAIPIDFAGSFNFTADLGAGVEFYRTKTTSIRADYRYHHISNHSTADVNPGIDNGVFQLTYAFGR